MGMFNSIYGDLRCPVKQEISRDTEIQIKWQHHRRRTLSDGLYLSRLFSSY